MVEKRFMTATEAAQYLGITRGYVYKLTCKKKIPFYSPTGRHILFLKNELDEWVLNNRVSTNKEIEGQAQNAAVIP
ncbi:MAG: helix-turn-helix domain-containing protein [Prevotella sp.]|jgi:excisionase family DNA binding protein|nr:helix-turn-helix domain-containing protein [Prevotella sp.]